MRSSETARCAELALAVLRGEIPALVAQAQVQAMTRPRPCRVGAGGVCLTHGQSVSECRRDNLNEV